MDLAPPLQLQPLTLDLARLDGLSPRLVASHHENNYAGAVRRLAAIRAQLAQLDWATAPVFQVNGLKREELVAANSAWLHELYFDGLGGDGVLEPGPLAVAIERDFGSVDRFLAEFSGLAKAMGGGSGWALLSFSSREGRLITHGASDHTQLLAGATPVLAVDMYEHAYHLDFGARAAAYVDAVMKNLRFDVVAARYRAAVDAATPDLGCAPACTADAPQLVDCRRAATYAQSPDTVAGATWRDPARLADWAPSLDRGRPVLVACAHGLEIGRGVALALRVRGFDARYVEGGVEGCREAGLAMVPTR